MYLNPFNGFGFKRLFANTKHPEPRRDFITHALAPFGIGEILETELLDRNISPDTLDIRGSTVDVLCRIPYSNTESDLGSRETASTNGLSPSKLQGGEQIIVEIQLSDHLDFLKRASFYSGGIYRNQLKKGEWYSKLKPVYFIALLDFCAFPGDEAVRWHTTCCLKTKEPTVGNIFMTTIELPKFTKTLAEFTSDSSLPSSQLDEWIYLLRHIREWDQIPDSFNRPAFTEAGQILWEGALTSEEQRANELIELNWQTHQLIRMDEAAKFAKIQEARATEAKKLRMLEEKE